MVVDVEAVSARAHDGGDALLEERPELRLAVQHHQYGMP